MLHRHKHSHVNCTQFTLTQLIPCVDRLFSYLQPHQNQIYAEHYVIDLS